MTALVSNHAYWTERLAIRGPFGDAVSCHGCSMRSNPLPALALDVVKVTLTHLAKAHPKHLKMRMNYQPVS